ncbi:hypothetical protein KHQ81_02935 [Mycoplasmatota bacterium]|nr:hypothetical protein KHQ81_02935 [Mycoplasmatota bacterium]
MKKYFDSIIMNHMKLFNFIISILLLTLFYILVFIIKYPIEDGMRAGLIDYYYGWIKYNIYDSNLSNETFFFILLFLGLLGSILLSIYLMIIALLNERIIKLLSIFSFLSIILVTLVFIRGIIFVLIPFLMICPLLFIIIIVQLMVNINYNKYKNN